MVPSSLCWVRALVAVPLKVEDRILGVLSVDNFRTERTLTARRSALTDHRRQSGGDGDRQCAGLPAD